MGRSASRGLLVADIERFAVGKQGAENRINAARLQRVLLRLHPDFHTGGVPLPCRRDGLCGRAQRVTNMIEINQVAALCAERASI